jgi:phthiocerol/phenolphthiocerol synthesis type-I polyketide synthase E
MSNLSTAQMTASDSATIAKLTEIWRELLGIDSIGVEQNYFDLGGDSSLAVQLFARIEKSFNIKLPLATLFEAPTIEGLARVLQDQTLMAPPAGVSGWSSLVAIQPNGARPRFFCMHGAGGNVLIYRDLARYLGSDQPFYGMQAQGLDGSCAPLTTIEEMAELYVHEIRKLQPHGPYLIGGYCMGGTLAYEVARQLRAAGEEISLLALFDTMDWYKIGALSFWQKTYQSAERLVFHAANFFRLDSKGKREFFDEKVEALRSRIPVWRGMLLAKFKKNDPSRTSQSVALARVWQANDRACIAYKPPPFPGVVTDFRPMKQYRMFDRPDAKWNQLAQGGEQVVVLPVYPAGMLIEPFVAHLAAALRKSIDAAVRTTKS